MFSKQWISVNWSTKNQKTGWKTEKLQSIVANPTFSDGASVTVFPFFSFSTLEKSNNVIGNSLIYRVDLHCLNHQSIQFKSSNVNPTLNLDCAAQSIWEMNPDDNLFNLLSKTFATEKEMKNEKREKTIRFCTWTAVVADLANIVHKRTHWMRRKSGYSRTRNRQREINELWPIFYTDTTTLRFFVFICQFLWGE